MIPILLTLQGVYSYQEKQVIDFEPLTQAGLFGIFGKVGSGKSSIVEAITYVLYGETNRINGRESLTYNMTNLRSTTFFIEYIFRVSDGKYKFVAQGRRNSKNFSDIKIGRTAYIWDNNSNDWSPISTDAPSILGLKYNDFRRAVIVPQGNFQEFLELKGTERSIMMQDLFGLEKFDLSANISTLKSANDLKISILEENILALGAITPEGIAQLEENLLVLQKENDLRQKTLTSIRKESEQIQQLKLQIDDAHAKKKILQQLENQTLDFQKRKDFLKQYRNLLTYVKPALHQLDIAEKEQHNATANLLNIEKNLKDITAKTITAQELETSLKTQYSTKDDLILEAEDWRTILKINDLEKILKSDNALLLQGEAAKKQDEEIIENLKAQRQIEQANLTKLTENQVDIVTVSEVLTWFATFENLQLQRVNYQKEANIIIEKEGDFLRRKNELIVAQGLDNQDDITLEAIGLQIENAIIVLNQKNEKIEQQRLNLLQQQALQIHVHTLHDGLPCPLCGAEHHPHPLMANADLSEVLKQLDKDSKQIKVEENRLAKQKEALIQLNTVSQYIENEKDRIKNAFELLKIEIAKHQETFVWKNFSQENKEAVKEAQGNYNRNEQEKARLQKQIETFQQNIEQKEVLLKAKLAQLQSVEINLATQKATKAAALKSLKKLDAKIAEQNTSSDILAKADALERQFQTIERDYQKAKTDLQQFENQLIKAKADLDNSKELSVQANEKFSNATKDLQTAIASLGFSSLAEVKDILAKAISVEQEENLIEKFNNELRIAQHNSENAEALIRGKIYDEIAHKNMLTEIQNIENQINTENQHIGIQKNNIDRAKQNIAKQAALMVEIATLKDRAANITILESLFKGKGFVNYVSRVYLQNVVGIANERFHRMTQHQLRLQLADDNAFEVLDLLNDGKTRSVKTLSGGQKFQASLCLALALADSISSPSRENFFFLDEGFGSLDKNALQVVFETLQSLRKENRVVGIISHVEEMQQEIERYIHVSLLESKGSIVEVI